MYEYFSGVAKILVPDNCKTAVVHNGGWKDQQINETYQEMAKHYETVTSSVNGLRGIGTNTYTVVNVILVSKRVEQQTYRSCMGLLKLAEKYSSALLEAACKKALSYTSSPSYKSVKSILVTSSKKLVSKTTNTKTTHKANGITRGADYYRK